MVVDPDTRKAIIGLALVRITVVLNPVPLPGDGVALAR